MDSAANVYVADSSNHTLRQVTPAGVVTTLAGNASILDMWGNPAGGYADGTGGVARFHSPYGVATDGAGNIYVADSGNNAIRKATAAGVVTTLAGSAGNAGSTDGTGSAARFNGPNGVMVDSAGNLFVADTGNSTIRNVTAAGAATTLAGLPGHSGSADGTRSPALFCCPCGVAVDTVGNLYVADTGNQTIRKVTPAGVVTTLAGNASILDMWGNPAGGYADGMGSAARFNNPNGVAVDSAGNVYVADPDNDTIRKVTPAGVVTTLAGSAGNYGHADGTGCVAQFAKPLGVAVDSAGSVYVADDCSCTIRMVTPVGVVTTVGGSVGNAGTADGIGSAARFYFPHGVAVDSALRLYVADSDNNRISKGIPVPPPQFQAITRIASTVVLSWTALPGCHYQLQSKTGLAQPNWLNLGAPIAATNGTAYASATVGPAPQRFYRVLLMP